ncbi:uncharacterized protein FTOL_01863 [Fusarium torulosum]|uniref:Uncharacterized protein n=1 Tax=Fusarium torulosum TaxID=33205 RepID=A0AAE8SDS2_9HYPO|nr:uncharacterized protein FTOL_01863 [Fusarium torulosum]
MVPLSTEIVISLATTIPSLLIASGGVIPCHLINQYGSGSGLVSIRRRRQLGPGRPACFRTQAPATSVHMTFIQLVFASHDAQAVKMQQPVLGQHSISTSRLFL